MPVTDAPTIEVHLTPEALAAQLAVDARTGLTADEKWIPPTWFYDDHGCDLFDQITRLPEYYPTRTERSILAAEAGEIVDLAQPGTVVELGSGTSEKTTILLDATDEAGLLERFVPFDVSKSTLSDAMDRLSERYVDVDFHGVVGDFRSHLGEVLAASENGSPRLVVFLGGTIGNFRPDERLRFHQEVAKGLGPDDRFLLGTDLVKDTDRLEAAYDDAAGVTAAFNKNVLSVMNRELGADFDPDNFSHISRWSPEHKRIEMRLRSDVDQQVDVDSLGLGVGFDAGEEMLTEISCKFTPDQIRQELAEVGLSTHEQFTDDDHDFLVTLAAPS
jgi:L-histidine N-alpha-methyltransferase